MKNLESSGRVKERSEYLPWINPIGGLGDALMLSGVLKLVNDQNPLMQYNLIRRTQYQSIFINHPVINTIGSPPKDAEIIETAYWSIEKIGENNRRPFQILSRLFGLTTPVEEKLYLPGISNGTQFVKDCVPWGKKKVVLIAPFSESPRKMMYINRWAELVRELKSLSLFVIQVGRLNESYIKGSYSLLGLTSPKLLLPIIKKCDLIITMDNFIMHLAHLANKPAIVLWGPTDCKVYGYPGHIHIQGPINHCEFKNKCLGPDYPQNYKLLCPLEKDHCLNKISLEKILNNVNEILNIY